MKKTKSKKNQKIIFIRHAVALDKKIASQKKIADADRELTAEGQKEFVKKAKKYKKLFKSTDLFVTSPYIRAIQTLDIIFDVLGLSVGEATVFKKSTPNDNPKMLIKWLSQQKKSKIVIVSHEPFMSKFMNLVFKDKWSGEKIKKGCIIQFQLSAKQNKPKLF